MLDLPAQRKSASETGGRPSAFWRVRPASPRFRDCAAPGLAGRVLLVTLGFVCLLWDSFSSRV